MDSAHWAVPLGEHHLADAEEVNAVLSRVFQAMRMTSLVSENAPEDVADSSFYVSDDQLLARVELPEFQTLIRFFVESIQKTVSKVNRGVWPVGKMSLQLQLNGCWFQIQNGMASHDVHTHGNCSWSGVYYVQVDERHHRIRHPKLKHTNGVTRFYGPYSQWQAGAYMDIGNAYLQKNHIDIEPHAGKLVVFPSYLPHQAMPYEGDLDRIIVSFNVQIHSAQGDQIFNFSAK